jgi:small subunit ribosomal protein S11
LATAKKSKKKEKKHIAAGIVTIQATFNNTIVTVSDRHGNVISWASAGEQKFRGAKKSTPYAAQMTTEVAIRKAIDNGLHEAEVHVKGPGVGRESAIRSIENAGVHVTMIRDVTPIPHNGCRPAKRRRV